MRQGQQNKRMRGRGRKGPNPLTRSYESNGPDVKIRGTALHIAEKYMSLARDAQSSGDRVAAESYLQHAEHYYRIVAAAQAQMPQQQQQPHPNPRSDEDFDDETEGRQRGNGQAGQPAFGLADPQPYVNGNGQDRSESGEAAAGSDDGGRERRESDQPQGSGHRGRRRRPYRDRQDRGEDGGDTSEPVAATAETPAEAAANDD